MLCGLRREYGYIESMDVRDDGQLSFRMRDSQGDFLVITDITGNTLSYQEAFPEDGTYPWNADTRNLYENRIFDNGDGTGILSHYDELKNSTELSLYTVENREETPLTVLEGEQVRSLCMAPDHVIYFTTAESLNRWSREDNVCVRLLELHGNGISAMPASNNLLINSQGEILLCDLEGSIPCVFVLSEKETQNEDKMRIAFLATVGSSDLSRPAQIFSYSHPEFGLEQEQYSGETETGVLRDRVFMELAAGKGPDLMWVNEEDMHILEEKGLLMELSGLISEDIKEQMLPGVIQSGTIDDRMVGLKLYAIYRTVFVSDAVWEKDTWTLADVRDILQSREDWDWAFSYRFGEMAPYGPYELLSEVLLADLEGSEFLDMEQGRCSFDSEEFVELIKLCKKYGQVNQAEKDAEEWYAQLKDGESIAHISWMVDGFVDFSLAMNRYEDSAHIVGFPTQEGGKNFILANSYLVVNANTEHQEQIRELIAYLLSYDNQYDSSYMSVRKDVIRDSVVYFEPDESWRLKISTTKNSFMNIEKKPDGTTWIEEYLAFLEDCVPEPNWRYTSVGQILSEELPAYFEGNKSAEDVADIIQRRVQLYLSETKG